MEKRNLDVFLTSELCLQQLKYHTWPNLLAQLYPNDGRFRRIGCWMARIGSTAAFWWPGTCPNRRSKWVAIRQYHTGSRG
jgi:hypothetical protein